MDSFPRAIVIFSGKRKSGKDYVTNLLRSNIGEDKCSILRLSAPLKEQYAKEHGLDFARLLDASDYKEKHRVSMITWGEEKRNKDPGFFGRIIASGPGSEKPVWIISDARRITDVLFFKDVYGQRVRTVRVQADLDVRKKRGWIFTSGVDDAVSECGLDSGVDFEYMVSNNGQQEELTKSLDVLTQHIRTMMNTAS